MFDTEKRTSGPVVRYKLHVFKCYYIFSLLDLDRDLNCMCNMMQMLAQSTVSHAFLFLFLSVIFALHVWLVKWSKRHTINIRETHFLSLLSSTIGVFWDIKGCQKIAKTPTTLRLPWTLEGQKCTLNTKPPTPQPPPPPLGPHFTGCGKLSAFEIRMLKIVNVLNDSTLILDNCRLTVPCS